MKRGPEVGRSLRHSFGNTAYVLLGRRHAFLGPVYDIHQSDSAEAGLGVPSMYAECALCAFFAGAAAAAAVITARCPYPSRNRQVPNARKDKKAPCETQRATPLCKIKRGFLLFTNKLEKTINRKSDKSKNRKIEAKKRKNDSKKRKIEKSKTDRKLPWSLAFRVGQFSHVIK